jgi:hypothetical protein
MPGVAGENVKPDFSKSSVKSGNENEKYAETVLGGIPGKKNVDEVYSENFPGNAPGSVMAKSPGAPSKGGGHLG